MKEMKIMATPATPANGNQGLFTVTFLHPRQENEHAQNRFSAELGPDTTGQHALNGLIGEGFLAPPSEERAYTLQNQKRGTSLSLSEPLSAQGIGNGDIVAVIQTNAGAARLTPRELRSRLGFDAEVLKDLKAPSLGAIRPYASAVDFRANRVLTPQEMAAGRAEFYTVDYTFPILVDPEKTVDKATACFDLRASGNYPYSSPVATFLTPRPWNMHVASSGDVCLGRCWEEAQGKMLFAQLVIHVMRLLNWDEPDRGEAHDAFSDETLDFWRDRLRSRPLHPNLIYPALPTELTHGVRSAGAVFRAAGGTVSPRTEQGVSSAAPRSASMFQPVRG
ncbi:MAG: hypothetical protein U0441_23445 [Polyangiaceae bacterium]